MPPVTLTTLRKMKASRERFACLTAYDATFAHLLGTAGIEVLLVGDSLGMVIQGSRSTVPVTLEDILYHTRCVAAGNQNALVMADLPYMTYAFPEQAVSAAARVMQAGANVVKLEAADNLAEIIRVLSARSIPTCAHIGLAPQAVDKLGGYRVQGRGTHAAESLIETAVELERAGADLLLIECIPASLASIITQQLTIPVIGIGAGPDTDGQILVMHDMLGATTGHVPKFVRNFLADAGSIGEAAQQYGDAVRAGSFPAPEHCFD